jgi:SAM-dependent methyltransferase
VSAAPLRIAEYQLRRHGPGHLLGVCWRQWRVERALARRGVHFRSTDPCQVAAAYAAMSAAEFDAINGRQDWANWRTIPRCLNGQVPDRPLRILDLGCGTGSSTRVLAFWAPSGSHVTGYELAEPLLAVARGRPCRHRDGTPALVDFVCQGVTEVLRDATGGSVAPASVDVVNASGVVGHHLDPQTVLPLVAELHRVLRPEGIAMLDVGPTLPEPRLTGILQATGFRKRCHCRSSWLDPTGEVVYQRQVRSAP